jgi:ABC-type transporter lipoprotein component MlaA
MGRWGLNDGAYVVWPFIGPSTARDSVGLIPDLWIDPVWGIHPHSVRYAAAVLRAFSKRADLLDASRILEEAALDKYVFQRDAHLQRRRSLIYDGNPPREPRIFGLEDQPRVEREAPLADQAPLAATVPVRQSSSAPALDAAARLLELPASSAHASGG